MTAAPYEAVGSQRLPVADVSVPLAALVGALGAPLACVDLETTGGHTGYDRITEVGVVRIDAEGAIEEWSSLIDPQRWIPAQITALTGIDANLLEGAPTFPEVCDALSARLEGHIVVAHNARFDVGFLKQAFQREGVRFQPPVLCSVKLSRSLFREVRGHGLDALMGRLGLSCADRHRASGDARVVAQFLARMAATRLDELLAACRAQAQIPSLPAHLPAQALETLPEGPGVYLIYGEDDVLLYVGKSVHVRRRVLEHFRSDHRAAREMRLAQQTRRIETIETAGELAALLLESRLIKERRPLLNRRLRRTQPLCTLAWTFGAGQPPEVVCGGAVVPGESYGAFRTARDARQALRRFAAERGLCDIRLGLQSGSGPCFGHQIERCRGACVGTESPAQHDLRLAEALQAIRIARWSYAGPIGLPEGSDASGVQHVIDQWIYLGAARDAQDVEELLRQSRPTFDLDTYRILLRFLNDPHHARTVQRLSRPGRWP
ncbi:MAG: exonuclease domain-containing protein [Steroidobacteraceae bacterium]